MTPCPCAWLIVNFEALQAYREVEGFFIIEKSSSWKSRYQHLKAGIQEDGVNLVEVGFSFQGFENAHLPQGFALSMPETLDSLIGITKLDTMLTQPAIEFVSRNLFSATRLNIL